MYSIEDRSIVFKNGLRHTFNDYIAEALPYDDVIVVRLENQGWKRTNQNIYGIDYSGRVLWQIGERIHAFADSAYVNIYRKNDLVDAYNWDGTILSLDPRTGEPLSENLIYSPSKRQPSKRQFI